MHRPPFANLRHDTVKNAMHHWPKMIVCNVLITSSQHHVAKCTFVMLGQPACPSLSALVQAKLLLLKSTVNPMQSLSAPCLDHALHCDFYTAPNPMQEQCQAEFQHHWHHSLLEALARRPSAPIIARAANCFMKLMGSSRAPYTSKRGLTVAAPGPVTVLLLPLYCR